VSLICLGYFPSAPVRPSFAVDIHMLRFVKELHHRSTPNISAWSATLESSLCQQNFVVKGKDSICRKFAKALQYYSLLATKANIFV
jgi:hypothetical protein